MTVPERSLASVERERSGVSGYFSKSQRGDSGYQKERMMNMKPMGTWMTFETRQAMLKGEVWKDIP